MLRNEHSWFFIQVDGEDESSKTDLHRAAESNDLSLVKKLLTEGADVDAKNRLKETPLHYAACNNVDDSHFEVIETLLKNGASVDAKNYRDQTPFHFLVQEGNLKIVQLFLDYKADVYVKQYMDRNLLFSAIHNYKNAEVLQCLIDLGLDVNHRDGDNKTPLHHVANDNICDNYMSSAEILLKNGADINLRDIDGKTPIWYLVQKGNARIIKLFSSFKADFSVKNESKETLLYVAVKHSKDVEVVQLLIDLGLDVHHRCSDGVTPLHVVRGSENETIKIMKCLLKNGGDMNAVCFDNLLPVQFAMHESFYSFNKKDKEEEWDKKLKFMMEHTDFNINNSEESNVLTMYADEPVENYEKLLEHLAILQVLDNPMHPAIFKEIQDYFWYRSYNEPCKNELLEAKNTKLGDSWITYFNLLVDSRRKLKNYAGNEDLINEFKKCDCTAKFPTYGASIVKNVNKAIKRRELYDKSVDLLSDCLPVFNPTHLIIRDILDRILSKKVLSKFCNQDFIVNY